MNKTTFELSATCGEHNFDKIVFDVPFEYTPELWAMLSAALPQLLAHMSKKDDDKTEAKCVADIEVTHESVAA